MSLLSKLLLLGTLQIIDRKKDLWKGPSGEYVSFSKVESAIKLSPYVELAMVYGRTGAQHPIVLICAHPVKFGELKASKGVKDHEAAVGVKDHEAAVIFLEVFSGSTGGSCRTTRNVQVLERASK